MSSYQAERQVILLSAGTAARRRAMREQAGRLIVEVDWSRLGERLRLRKLLPVLGPRILELAEGSASGGFTAAVEQALEAGRRQGAFLQLISLRVMAMLADAGIRSIVLKGPLLGEAIYGDPGRRLSSDIDLLVAPEQLQPAVEVVRALGYDAPTDYVQDCGLPLLHFVLAHERGELPPVELHWRVHWYERSFAHQRLLPPAVDPLGDWRPAPADEARRPPVVLREGWLHRPTLGQRPERVSWWDAYGADLPHSAHSTNCSTSIPRSRTSFQFRVEVAEKIVGPTSSANHPRDTKAGPSRIAWLCELANPNPHTSQSQLVCRHGFDRRAAGAHPGVFWRVCAASGGYPHPRSWTRTRTTWGEAAG